jgi:protein dithiol oxidoreductase (disulfide-forming)
MKRFLCLVLLGILFHSAIVVASPLFTEGEDYVLVINNSNTSSFPENKVTVTEFFSYGCPWCYQLEPKLQAWLKKKPSNLIFERVPVIFEPHWENYAKAYYVAKALGIESKLTPKLFNAIQEKNKTLGTESAMSDFFIKQGVKKEVAESAFQPSPSLDAQVKQAPQLMQAYQIYVVPAFVVDGKYRTDLQLAMDEKKLLAIVSFLIEKREAEKKLAPSHE